MQTATMTTPFEHTLEYAAILSGLSSVGNHVSDQAIAYIKEDFIKNLKKVESPLESPKQKII